MKVRVAAILLAASVLGGCTDADWDHAFSYVGLDSGAKPAAEPAAQAADAQANGAQPGKQVAAAPGDQWCAEVAKAAIEEAAGQGFDEATQRHRGLTALKQCAGSPSAN